MIFLTIGTQEPFDRLFQALEQIAQRINLDIVAQNSPNSAFTSNLMEMNSFMAPEEFERSFDLADLVIAHAGMGTIISGLVKGKPLIVFPRHKSLGEHRSDHQQATAKYFGEIGYINVANSVDELEELIKRFISGELLGISKPIGNYASDSLIKALKNEILSK
ncbi:glycosyltransferase [Algoriphagus winogradskyi]|uniref:UDP-N-acetylglucosamine transferase subunit ALG13 n=1 Tax=Algoriphagus winogradskyi TaxID=237017 RepID=A0ABY1PG48_9BACT|nr:glycosyltransferase [Algoriphagus winogradskyi]SMP33416.1 UDP-N-acetylglucosamine transferase subunit ALG13 [Algoriphagus winogradskyi]